ncbi:MAG: phosphatidylglycerol lysyltransferase domain-containing protein [Tateyamaria sp.]|uniref:phosphatidylglycerol lysyltransferase domain-containing protein n=2 Tax=Rhodobacterales TaxID=204455 RepID=UPI00328EFD16
MRFTFASSHMKFLMRAALPTGAFALCAVLLAQYISVDHLRSLPARLGDIAPWRWVMAATFTLGSFWAVAQYDALAHRALSTGISNNRARITGAIGIALGQTLGFGVVTGALARWRMLCDLSLTGAARVSAFVCATFVVCWAIVTALVCIVMPAPEWTFIPSLTVVACLPILAAMLIFFPVINWMKIAVHLPNLRISGAILFWALVDTSLASGALFILLPAGTLAFITFLPLFLIALGCGLVSNTPGGIGPFELVLISALPLGDPTHIMAAILGYRIIYYALPATIAGIALLRPFAASKHQKNDGRVPSHHWLNHSALIAQNGGTLARRAQSMLALWPTGQTVTQFCDPVAGTRNDALQHLKDTAKDTAQLPMIYKCGAHMAATARLARWKVLHIADEAIVPLASYNTASSAHRGLRRKLRNAAKANVILRAGHPLPFAAMARVDAEWQTAHGRARGGSMGRYCPHFVSQQWVACAYLEGRLVGFITATHGGDTWQLDVMRHSKDMPDGAMHSLVNTAILAAKNAGALYFSLDAAPACPDPKHKFWHWVTKKVATRAGGSGLRQFKSSFAPVWKPRYAAAPTWGALTLGLIDITRAIQRPIPLAVHDTQPTHNVDENYELASFTAT